MTITRPMAEIMRPGDVRQIEWRLKAVLEGNPIASYCVVGRSDDGCNISGVWECTPGRFEVHYTWDETIYVLEGRVSIEEENGDVREFKAGDVVHFPIGLRCTWTVHEKIRKIYALFSPEPLEL